MSDETKTAREDGAMMTVKELKKRKKELGYTNAMVSERSGVPLGTVQKILSGATKNPRIDTLEALEMALKEPLPFEFRYDVSAYRDYVAQDTAEYISVSGEMQDGGARPAASRVDHWKPFATPTERWPKQGSYTTDDYYAIPDQLRVELIDGCIYDLGSPNVAHQRIVFKLAKEFDRCIEEHGKECEVLSAPLDVRLDRDNTTMVEPDIIIVCDPEWEGNETCYDGAPELIAEVLSPSTRDRDCTIKLRKYMNAGVKEYWIVDPKNEKVMVYVFEEDYLPTQYSFDDTIPVGISGGKCSIDFSRIKKRLK